VGRVHATRSTMIALPGDVAQAIALLHEAAYAGKHVARQFLAELLAEHGPLGEPTGKAAASTAPAAKLLVMAGDSPPSGDGSVLRGRRS
jgi:hypothetical protein